MHAIIALLTLFINLHAAISCSVDTSNGALWYKNILTLWVKTKTAIDHRENELRCNTGYSVQGGSRYSWCRWPNFDPPMGVCAKACSKDEGGLNALNGGTISLDKISYTLNEAVTVSCTLPLEPVDSNQMTITCQRDGTWNPLTASPCRQTCVKSNGGLENLGGGKAEPDKSHYSPGESVKVLCSGTLELSDPSRETISCLEGGTWDQSASTCQKTCSKDAGELNALNGGTISLDKSSYSLNEAVTVSCTLPLEPVDRYRITITCQKDGIWNPSTASPCRQTCVKSNGGLENLGGGKAEPDKSHYSPGESVKVLCGETLELSDPSRETILCLDGGTWDQSASTCQKTCSKQSGGLLDLNGGTLNFDEIQYSIDESVTVSCSDPYELVDINRATIRCQDDGNWNIIASPCRSIPCVKSTGGLDLVTFGNISLDKPAYELEEEVNVSCWTNFKLIDPGRASIKCQLGGVWSQTATTCEREKTVSCARFGSIIGKSLAAPIKVISVQSTEECGKKCLLEEGCVSFESVADTCKLSDEHTSNSSVFSPSPCNIVYQLTVSDAEAHWLKI